MPSLPGLALSLLLRFSFGDKRHDPASVCTLFPLEGRNDCLEIVAVLPRYCRSMSADFIDDGIVRQ